MSGFLKVVGTKIVDEDGQEVALRGAGLGGWMTMENFIAGAHNIGGMSSLHN
ncbi:Endo-1,4-beta-xylanase 5 [Taiwanofungus camphoratus]|nr:Endo-1,4-beta-xylanase 5 [Antrodia cinnamomea]KAI0942500.1 Endo-1,4-beta-xylanase 5 [Antrodia cinnamomea]